MAAAMVKLIRIASSDCRKLMFNPSSGASMPLSSALPKVVSRRMRGSLSAVYAAWSGARQQPTAHQADHEAEQEYKKAETPGKTPKVARN